MRCARRGAEPRTSAWKSPVAAGAAGRAPPSPVLPCWMAWPPQRRSPSSESITTPERSRRPGSAATSHDPAPPDSVPQRRSLCGNELNAAWLSGATPGALDSPLGGGFIVKGMTIGQLAPASGWTTSSASWPPRRRSPTSPPPTRLPSMPNPHAAPAARGAACRCPIHRSEGARAHDQVDYPDRAGAPPHPGGLSVTASTPAHRGRWR